ncbi:MAG: ribonuclease P protein component [Clostridiales bacterium]|nr:ribonuclease P protein component [Clostridiales bacterium]
MHFTESLTENRNFMRLYRSGKNAAGAAIAVYCKRNNLGMNRLGITVSVKLGGAVIRNRTRRRIKEAYRLHEAEFRKGYDIVIVARHRAKTESFCALEQGICKVFQTLGMMKEEK